MYFTLIIPAYNCQDTIDRLMQSIVEQHFDDLKIIIVDDSDEQHKGLEEKYINKYKKDLNIDYYVRWAKPPKQMGPYTCHCPGNTRHNGLYYALKEDTKYIFFADCDDEFEPNTFQNIHDKLEEFKEDPVRVLLTPFFMWNEETLEKMTLEKHNIGWLHGKFYLKDFLVRNNIQFKVNLATHEDVFFNTTVNNYLVKEGSDFLVYDFICYKWYYRLQSESHLKAHVTGQNFLEEHFRDYVEAVTLPALKMKDEDPQHERQYGFNAMNVIVTTYFYFQGFLCNGNPNYFKQNYELCKWQVLNVCRTFKINKDTIIALCQDNPDTYCTDRNECIKGVGNFVETQSFADWIRDMKFYV